MVTCCRFEHDPINSHPCTLGHEDKFRFYRTRDEKEATRLLVLSRIEFGTKTTEGEDIILYGSKYLVLTCPRPGGAMQTVFRTPQINIYSHDVMRLVKFYEDIGFRETFRTPKEGEPDHVELALDQIKIGIASVNAAASDHGLRLNLAGHTMEIVLWNDDTDSAYTRLTAKGAPSLSPPHDFLGFLRVAWVADPDGNPVQLVQRR